MYHLGVTLSPDTKEIDFTIMGDRFDETNEYHIEFLSHETNNRRTIILIPDDGKDAQTVTNPSMDPLYEELMPFHCEIFVDGDLSGHAIFSIGWYDDRIEVEVIKGDDRF